MDANRGEPGGRRVGLSLSGVLDDSDSPGDVVDLLLLDAFASGREPFARSCELVNVHPAAALLPEGVQTLRDAEDDHSHNQLWAGEGWTAHVIRWKRQRTCTATVTAVSPDLAAAVLAAVEEAAADHSELPAERVAIGFWHLARHGPRRISRDVDAPLWARVRANYPRGVAAAIEPLLELGAAGPAGRLLLLHGPPGTGKTTLLRSLALCSTSRRARTTRTTSRIRAGACCCWKTAMSWSGPRRKQLPGSSSRAC